MRGAKLSAKLSIRNLMTLHEYLDTFVNDSVKLRIYINGKETKQQRIDNIMGTKEVLKASTKFMFGVLEVHIFLKTQKASVI